MSGTPGRIAFIGSGETSAVGGRVFEAIALDCAARLGPERLRLALLETPAGFEVNSPRVAGRVGDYLQLRLQQYHPVIDIVAARRRGGPDSTDDEVITQPLLHAGIIYAGAGSPTYAVRQLMNSLAWRRTLARHFMGASLVFASAGAIAAGSYTLPVYEIFKAGHDLHWRLGLDVMGHYGLDLVVVSHWNNAEGGAGVDTSRCFMGVARFEALKALLPPTVTILGVDEHTAVICDVGEGWAQVLGTGSATLIHAGRERSFVDGQQFALEELGSFRAEPLMHGLPNETWAEAIEAAKPGEGEAPPAALTALVDQREQARARRDWPVADALRASIEASGWTLNDTAQGPQLIPPGRQP